MHVYMAFRSGRACACLTAYAHGQRLLGVNIYDITLHSVECGKNALSFAIKKKKHIYTNMSVFLVHIANYGREGSSVHTAEAAVRTQCSYGYIIVSCMLAHTLMAWRQTLACCKGTTRSDI